MAALTTPIVRSDMRLYPGMPVKRVNVRARAANRKQKVINPLSLHLGPQGHQFREFLSKMSVHMVAGC